MESKHKPQIMKGPVTDPEERRKALESALAHVEHTYGKGTIMRMGDGAIGDIPVISSGDIGLDLALGVGGYPQGRVVEIFGPEASGKTTLALHAVAQVQKKGGIAAVIDAEHALDVRYARRIGVQTADLLVSQPDCGEQALSIVEILVRSASVDVVVIDSVAALVPRSELKGEMGDPHMAQQARLMSQALRKLTAVISRSRTVVIFINQLRMKMGASYGNLETTSGGNALKFYASVRLDVRRYSPVKEGEAIIGSRVRVKVVKNKVAPPFRQAEFDLLHSCGISREGSLLDWGVDLEVIKKSGTWFSYADQRIGQGRENARRFLSEHPEVCALIETQLRKTGTTEKVEPTQPTQKAEEKQTAASTAPLPEPEAAGGSEEVSVPAVAAAAAGSAKSSNLRTIGRPRGSRVAMRAVS